MNAQSEHPRSGAARRALLVVDVQRDFCEGGSLAVAGGLAVAAAVKDLITGAHDYAAVVATRDHHVDPGDHFSDSPDFVDSWPRHCVVGTEGVELADPLGLGDFAAVFDKGEFAPAYSGFEGRDVLGASLADWLRAHEVDTVDVCGIATDYCVRATAADAAAEGFRPTVLLDLTAAVAPDRLPAILDALEAQGVQLRRSED